MNDITRLYREHAPEVFRFALFLAGDRAEAEDITSETFVRVWTSPEPVRMATVRAYLFTIARNLFLQGLRRKRRQAKLADDFPDPDAGPGARIERQDEVDSAIRALQTLPEVDRAALVMRAFGEMSYEEISQALGISLAAVKVKIHRARLALAGVRER